jgi:uncharacterized repeat protein (TIGR01451 family)
MKYLPIMGIAMLSIATPAIAQLPSLTNQQHQSQIPAQNVPAKRAVQLNLVAEKIVQRDAQGKQKVFWQPMQGKVVVMPKDVIRYTVIGKNAGTRPAENLVVTQPIPRQTAYVLNSANTIDSTATITYSIDNGITFVAKPTIKVKFASGKVEVQPAPAELYTHVRWKFKQAIAPTKSVNAAYLVRVK